MHIQQIMLQESNSKLMEPKTFTIAVNLLAVALQKDINFIILAFCSEKTLYLFSKAIHYTVVLEKTVIAKAVSASIQRKCRKGPMGNCLSEITCY